MNARTPLSAVFLAAGLSLFSASVPAALAAAESGTATFTVTAIGKKGGPPAISKDDVQLTLGKERKQIAQWTKAEKLYLAILIDDSLNSDVAGQWSELKQFIDAQPATTYIAVGYAGNSTVRVAQDFTTDHELAAKALRIPLGFPAAYSSPYLSVIDWMKRWPASGDRRSLLLISSGTDYFRGGFGPIYPDVDSAISRAEKENINLWNIYYPGAGHRSRSFFLANMAQNNLSKLCEETGGEAYFLGTSAPVSFKPYLDEMQMHLDNQYLLTFAGDGGPKGKFASARLKTELAGVEFMHANQAWLPPAK
ncbi:MAG: hypothetical protein JSS69_01965 [Acidobacteria bacterium]|nr:hypothetical protein [Acidobacteriota bacterium]MBS1864659.1 hypothetical protein [Acidobacteriota bacterium]